MPTPQAPSNNAAAGSAVPACGILQARVGAARILTLDRPSARNALDGAMTSALAATIPKIARDAETYAIVLRSSRPGTFCAGGDVRALVDLAAADPRAAQKALADEYALVWMLECFSKPVISLIDGLVMGSGAGITLVNTHRVAAESYGFAMPEVHLGFFPDDGVAYYLGRLPGAVGEYLALTGRRLHRADAYGLGLVTHCIDAQHFPAIERHLANADPVDPILDGLHVDPGPGSIAAQREQIDHCFSAAAIEDIVARLRATSGEWAAAALADIERASPLALKIALRHVRQARALDLRLTLAIDYRLGVRMIAGADFKEGVRAALIDKDRNPVWHPGSTAEISDSFVEELFKTDPLNSLHLATRQEMQAARI